MSAESEVRKLLGNWEKAFRARDLDAMMSFYGPEVVFYDGVAPLQLGREAYRKNWDDYFNCFPGPPGFEARHLKIAAGDRAAFSRSLVRLTGTVADGKEEGGWLRQTIGFENINGKWMITHEHWSMPMDMESGKALTDLQPD